ncbi:MAG: Fur family transcriptional regulator [Promethearchaeota archaeon]
MKLTNQRVAILDFLKDNLNHPTVEEIFEEVKRKLPRITKATVYKNLNVLVDNNLIKEVNVKGVSRFEAKMAPHHHLVCKTCGKILDYKSKELTDYALRIIKEQTEIIIDSAETTFFGQCKSCKTD